VSNLTTGVLGPPLGVTEWSARPSGRVRRQATTDSAEGTERSRSPVAVPRWSPSSCQPWGRRR
jgi:hypothetical protein